MYKNRSNINDKSNFNDKLNFNNNCKSIYAKNKRFNSFNMSNELNQSNQSNQSHFYMQYMQNNINKFGKYRSQFVSNNNDIEQIDKIKRDSTIGCEIDITLKSELLDYLYLNVDLYQLRYCILKTEEHTQILKQQIYHVTPHFHGYNYFLIIKELSNGEIGAYMIYRMDLKFTREEVKPQNTKIYKINTSNKYMLNMFNNSIFDGKLIFKKDEKLFLISDILYSKGKKCLTIKLMDKFNMFEIVNDFNNLSDIDCLNIALNINFSIKFIKLYTYADMTNLIYNKIKNSDYKINGIVFLPSRSNRIFIYINDEEFENIKNSPNFEMNSKTINIRMPLSDTVHVQKLLLQKTQNIDVYDVFTLDKSHRFGICCVPNMVLSHKLANYFDSHDQLIVDCEFDNKFSKWKPLF